MSYIGVKEIISEVLFGQPALGYEILFRDKKAPDRVKFSPSYKPLKKLVETALPNVQVNISRCHEGKISFVTMGITSDYEREKLIVAVRDKIVDILESGYSYDSIEDLCAEFCCKGNPRIHVHSNGHGDCLAIEYWRSDVCLDDKVLEMKLDQINAITKGAFICIKESTTAPYQISLLCAGKHYGSDDYHVADAVREIVEMLEAACPKNKHYDPDYFRKMMV